MESVTATACAAPTPPAHSADSAACGLSTPAVTSPMMTRPSAIRYQTNGMKLLVETYFMNHAMTAYPDTKATTVADSVGPHATWPLSVASVNSKAPEASTAGTASRKE